MLTPAIKPKFTFVPIRRVTLPNGIGYMRIGTNFVVG